jgi:hypothetical protein
LERSRRAQIAIAASLDFTGFSNARECQMDYLARSRVIARTKDGEWNGDMRFGTFSPPRLSRAIR